MINIGGAKNSTLPILSSTILCKNNYVFNNFTSNNDVVSQIKLLEQFGVKCSYQLGQDSISIDSTNLAIPKTIDFSDTARANYYFIGSSIHYNQQLDFLISNGCNIDERNIDFHLKLLELLGKNFKLSHNRLFIDDNNIISNQKLELLLPRPSVGATINALLMFCKGSNVMTLKNYAKDPYIFEQIKLLKLLGANIKVSESSIVITGTELVNNKKIIFDIIPDPIEAISYIIFSSVCLLKNQKNKSNFTVGPIIIKDLGIAIDKLKEIGISLIESKINNYFYIQIRDKLKSFNMSTDYFPGIYTDSQPFFALLASFIEGTSKIRDIVYPQRFSYICDYRQYGIDILLNGDIAVINGKELSKNNNESITKQIYLKDLRSGAATFFLNKLFDSPYKLNNNKYIDRGYSNYDHKSDQALYNLDIVENYPTSTLSNIKIGGRTKFYTEANKSEDIEKSILFSKKNKCKFKVIGSGCNIYFSAYYDGIIIKNNIRLCNIVHNNNAEVTIAIGSGNLLQDLIEIATENQIDIHELCDIPGTIGGAIYGNAGAYGLEIKDFLKSVVVYDPSELKFKTICSKDLYLSYRNSGIKDKKLNYILTEAVFVFRKSNLDIKSIIEKNKKVSSTRRLKMPYNNTLGCVFKNTENNKVGEILDSLIKKGESIGNITISNNHSNIWINNSACKPQEFDDLISIIQEKIKIKNNIDLKLEIEKI